MVIKKIIFASFIILILGKGVFAAPKISILNSPTQINKNEEFGVTFNITKDILSSDLYYIKGRIGSSSASMNQGETFNSVSNTWLSDTASWNTFPFIAFLNSSIATSTVTLRAKSTAFTGNNFLIIRLNRNSTSYDSSSSTLFLIDPPTPTLTPMPTIEPSDSAQGKQSNNEIISVTPSPTPISYNNIYISEVMANPPPGENEWIELFNNNDFSVSLTNWFIDDIENGGSSPKLFSLDIPAKNYGVIKFTSSLFNNTGDSVRLLDFNKSSIDDFEYASTTQEKTLGRTSFDSDEFCLQEPSKGNINNSCINPTPTPIPTPQPTHKPANSPYLPTAAVANRSITRIPSVSINQLINTSNNSTPMNRLIGGGEVLGSSNQNSINNHNRLIRSLSFISFSYSLLTILSIFLRIKNSYEKGL